MSSADSPPWYVITGGPSSGKTTTIRMMCGLLTPDGGTGRVLDYDIRRDSAAIKREVGYMTQRFSFYEDLTIEENLRFVAGLYRLSNARDAVASVQIDPRLPVIPVRAMKNKGTEEFTKKQVEIAAMLDRGEIDMETAQLEIEKYWAGALRRAVIDGDVEYGSVMAGQSVGMVHVERPVVDIIAKLVDEANIALAR